ncbi:hypothetical protein OG218_00585 [Kineococcus sp. NBC_00420]|uniref:hypothetical protein n=1 Tax=Kineococcus sp. NBC_00420 TaxID=2903564 RepID=UPI002E2350EA
MTEPTNAAGAPLGTGTGWTPTEAPLTVTDVEIVSTTPVPVVETADQVAALVLAVPGVVELHPGRFGEVATYLPGRRVAGVKLRDDVVEVHVVAAFDTPLRAVAQQIHAVVAAVVTAPVQVFIEDLTAPHAA